MFPMMIALTDRNGERFYLNAQRITSVSNDPDNVQGSLIYVDATDDELPVREPTGEVHKAIQTAIADHRLSLAAAFAHYLGTQP